MAEALGRVFWLGLLVVVSGCSYHSGKPEEYSSGRYQQRHDSGPTRPQSVDHIPDAVPIPEPRTAAGNKSPYRVAGKTYRVLDSELGYNQDGTASWYGAKFHGHTTSNGEIYNMYGMTAAHKTLPIPSYVQVTNLANNKQVIVRVNDRGPFHANRIIDLTYSAAKKLGFVDAGTARVRVTAIDPVQWQKDNAHRLAAEEVRSAHTEAGPRAPAPKYSGGFLLPDNTYLQVGAFSDSSAAENLRARLAKIINFPVTVNPPGRETTLYRVRIGPIADNFQASSIRQLLIEQNISTPYLVYEQ